MLLIHPVDVVSTIEASVQAEFNLPIAKDIKILENLYSGYKACKESSHNLGVVLEDMVEKLDYNGHGMLIHDLHYVVEARRCIRSMIEAIEGLEPDFENVTVK